MDSTTCYFDSGYLVESVKFGWNYKVSNHVTEQNVITPDEEPRDGIRELVCQATFHKYP